MLAIRTDSTLSVPVPAPVGDSSPLGVRLANLTEPVSSLSSSENASVNAAGKNTSKSFRSGDRARNSSRRKSFLRESRRLKLGASWPYVERRDGRIQTQEVGAFRTGVGGEGANTRNL